MSDRDNQEIPVNHTRVAEILDILADRADHCAMVVSGEEIIAKYRSQEDDFRTASRITEEYIASVNPMDSELDEDDKIAFEQMRLEVIERVHAWAIKQDKDPETLEKLARVEKRHQEMVESMRSQEPASPAP